MRHAPTLVVALAFVAAPVAAQTPPPEAAAQVRETAGCAAVFMVMAQMASNPSVTGGDPLAGALGGAFARSFGVKGRSLYARAAEQARRDRLPPESVFEAGVGYLVGAYSEAAASAPAGTSVDFTTEAAKLVERCVVTFPDPGANF